MKFLKTYEYWTTNVTDNFDVNYGDEKEVLSKEVIDVIKFIEDNFDNISTEVLNDTTLYSVGFKGGLKYEKIKLFNDRENKTPYINYYYRDFNDQWTGYGVDITEYEYNYLKDYFFKIYKIFKKKNEEVYKEKHASELAKIEDRKLKNDASKYNI